MNYLIKSIVLCALVLLMACSDQAPEAGDQQQKPKAYVFTHYSDKTELFVEFRALIVGQSSPFAAHFSTLSDFQPVAEGTVTVILSSKDQPTERFSTDSPVCAGHLCPESGTSLCGQTAISRRIDIENVYGSPRIRRSAGLSKSCGGARRSRR